MSLNFALVIDGNASGGKRAANEVTVAVQDLGREVRNTSANMQAAANANRQAETSHRAATEAIRGETAAQRDLTAAILQFAGVRAPTADSGLAARQADLDAYGSALDQIRAKHVPLFAVQRQYGEQLEEIAAAARLGAISEDERAAAAMRAKAAYDLQIMSLTRGGASTKLAAHEIQNLSFQVNDIAMMLLSGQSFGIIMAQQGGQIAQIFGRRGLGEIIPALGTGIASLVSPTTMALAAITALYYGASYAFSAMSDDVDKVDKELEEHRELISRVAKEWGAALPGLKAYNDELERQKRIRDAIAAQRLVVQEKYSDAQAAVPNVQVDFAAARVDLQQLGVDAQAIDLLQGKFDELKASVASGKAEVKDVDAVLKLLAQTTGEHTPPAVEAAVASLKQLSEQLAIASREAEKFRLIQDGGIINADGRTSILSPLNPLDGFNGTPFQNAEQIMFERSRRQRELEEQLRLGKELGGFVPMPAPNREDALPSANDVLRGQEERLEFLRLEAQLIGASDAVRARLMARLEAEQDLRRRGIDLQSEEARSVIANAEAIAEAEGTIERGARAWDRFRSAGENAIDTLVDKLAEGDIEGALDALGKDSLKYALEMAVKNPLKNLAFNDNLPTMADLPGVIARMFGGADKGAESAIGAIAGQTVGSMNVTAATVMINGGIAGAGGIVGNPAANVTKLLSPANGNDPNVGSTIDFMRAGKAGGGADYNVANATAFIRQYAEQIGIDPDIALRVARSEGLANGVWQSNLTRNGFREPSFGPFQLLKGGAGTGYGTGLGNAFLRQTGLDPADPANWQQSTAFALQQAKQGGWGPWFGARDQGITGFMGIDRNAPNVDPAEILKSFQGTSDAVSQLGKVALPATDNLNLFGTGLGDLGKALGSAGAGGQGGGILSWIMQLLGGIPGFAGGTEGAPEGWAWVGENGRELKKLRQGDVIRSAPRSQQMVAESQAAAGLAIGGDRQAVTPLLIPQKETIVYNNGPVDVTTRQEDDGQGGVREEIYIEERVAGAISRRGSAANRALREGGMRQKGPRR